MQSQGKLLSPHSQSLPRWKRGPPQWSPAPKPPGHSSGEHLPSSEHRGTAVLPGPGCLLVMTRDWDNSMSKWHGRMPRWEKKSMNGSEGRGRRTYLKCSIHTHAGFVPAFWPHSCTKEVLPLSHGEGTSEQSVGSPRCGLQLTTPVPCLVQDCLGGLAGQCHPRALLLPCLSTTGRGVQGAEPQPGPASLSLLLSLPKPSPTLLGAATSPTSLRTLLHL